MNLNKRNLSRFFLLVSISLAGVPPCNAGDPSHLAIASSASADSRYGFFDLLDRRSGYGQDVFPEPFLNDDSDLETDEFRVGWLRTGVHSRRSDDLKVEIEKAVGLVTFEAEFHYDWERADGKTTDGAGSVNLGARCPVFQYVSRDAIFDTTFGIGIEVGIPTHTPFSNSTELVPKIFNDTRLGRHLTIQTLAGYSALYGGDEDGIQTLEYRATVGWTISRKELPIPGVQRLTPVFEIAGEKQLNKVDRGRGSVLGNAGFRVNLNAVGPVQPRLGWGFVFPMNSTAREDFHWGVFTSLVFEY